MNRQELEALIRQTAVREGVPPELFMRLVGAESRFDHSQVSPKGAIGLAQLMPDTAKELGVDPSDIGQNLAGGARYLRQQLDRFGSYPLALAAYNAGPSRVANAGNQIPNISETQDYVNKIMEGLTLSPLSATKIDDEQPYVPALYQQPQPQQRGLMGFLSGLGQPSQTTGLNFMNKLGMAAATLNPMNPMSGEYIKSMQLRGQQALNAKGRNQTIEMLKRKAQQGDAVAGQIAAGIESGGISAKDGMDAYYKYTLTPKKQTSKIETYEYARNTLNMSHEDALKWSQTAASTNITLPSDEKAWQKGMGEYGVKRYESIQDTAETAQELIDQANLLKGFMRDPNFFSGALADQKMAYKKIIEAMGGEPANVSSLEGFQAVASELILSKMGGSLGAGFSEGDRKFVERMGAQLTTTKEGNALIIAMQEAVAERQLMIAAFADEYVGEHGMIDAKFNQALRKWAEENPLEAQVTVAEQSSYFD
jgi:hypothetical protein